MKNKNCLAFLFVFAALLFVSVPAFAIAQTAPASTATVVSAPAAAPSALAAMLPSLVVLITPIFSLVVTWAVKSVSPHIPGVFFPLIASVCGLLPDLIAHYTAGIASNPVLGLMLGLAATGLHQISAQLKPDGTAAPAPGTQ